MRIKASGKKWALYRYSGLADGKGVESKIGSVQAGTLPSHIPEDLRENLTPRELRDLQEHLARELVGVVRDRIAALGVEAETLAGQVSIDVLDKGGAAKLASSLSSLQSAVRRVRREHEAAQPAAPASGDAAAGKVGEQPVRADGLEGQQQPEVPSWQPQSS